MPENPPAANTPVNQPGLEYIIRFFALVPMALYMIVAALLTIIAVFSVYDAAQHDRHHDRQPRPCRRYHLW